MCTKKLNGMITVKAELRNYTKKDGTCQVRIAVRHQRKKYLKPLSISVKPENWENEKVINHQKAKSLNAIIESTKNDIYLSLLDIQRKQVLTPDIIRDVLNPEKSKEKVNNPNLFGFIENQIEILKNNRAKQTIRGYKSKFRKIKEIMPDIKLSEIDSSYLSELKNKLIERGNKGNTIWDTEKWLQSMIERAIPKYIKYNPYKNFDKTRYETQIPRFLIKEEVEKLEKLVETLGNSKLKRSGIYFLADIEIGLRIGDLQTLDAILDIKDGRIIKKTSKGKTIVSFKLSKKLKSYLDYIKKNPFEMIQSEYDRQLKKLGSLAGIKTTLSSHVARHTLGYRLANANVNISVAQKILGHKSIKSTEVYYHISDKQIDDAIDKIEY